MKVFDKLIESKEELANFIYSLVDCFYCPARKYCDADFISASCGDVIENWLDREIEQGEKLYERKDQ